MTDTDTPTRRCMNSEHRDDCPALYTFCTPRGTFGPRFGPEPAADLDHRSGAYCAAHGHDTDCPEWRDTGCCARCGEEVDVDHRTCPPDAHNTDADGAPEEQAKTDDGLHLRCNDCGLLIAYCTVSEWYVHVEHPERGCFLIGARPA